MSNHSVRKYLFGMVFAMACMMPWSAQSQCFPKQYIDPLYGISQNAAIQYGAADPYDILGLSINQNLFLDLYTPTGDTLSHQCTTPAVEARWPSYSGLSPNDRSQNIFQHCAARQVSGDRGELAAQEIAGAKLQ